MYKVLLVEDEALIREGIAKMIEQWTADFAVVKEAVHGKEALAYLSSDMPDLVITDIRMREMNGLDLIQKIRERYADLPIAIISGYGDFAYAQQALRCGVEDYLLKPVNRMAFVSMMDKIRDKLDKKHGRSRIAEEPPTDSGEDSLPDDTPKDHRLVRKIKEYIAANIEGDLSLQAIADVVDLHRVYLSQLFKQETGLNLSDHITEVRMERAKYLLTHTQLKIYDVARLSGYQSPKHFSLVFKQHTSSTPGAYRTETSG
ncbi:putative response regulatory protein [Paenibacillus solanacearum]|uniref:Response regulatory protein n=1 Tax=Paenibacillus solanacearum TaxID=2048548 RepID=A0A916K5P5_9BACL|nr:response regulator [Paenibacillus solanacearum]CAG7635224.1 putative response regulatory protein [Paenibacillus solanacearum]